MRYILLLLLLPIGLFAQSDVISLDPEIDTGNIIGLSALLDAKCDTPCTSAPPSDSIWESITTGAIYGKVDDSTSIKLDSNIVFQTDSTNRMTISEYGTVGIGIAPSTSYSLLLAKPALSSTAIGFQVGGVNYGWGYASGSTVGQGFYYNATAVMGISPTGTVSIGNSYVNQSTLTSGLIVKGIVGIGTKSPTLDLTFGGAANRVIGIERTTSGAGNSLTVNGGGAASGSTDQGSAGLVIQAANFTTGDEGANIYMETIASGQGSGTTDRTPDTIAVFSGTGMDLYGTFTLDSLMNISIGADTIYNKALGNIKLNDADSTLYMYDGKKWQALFTR